MVVEEPTSWTRLVLGFSPQDLKGVAIPCNDVLVIRAIVVNFDVARVFVYAESSVNILFLANCRPNGNKSYRLATSGNSTF